MAADGDVDLAEQRPHRLTCASLGQQIPPCSSSAVYANSMPVIIHRRTTPDRVLSSHPHFLMRPSPPWRQIFSPRHTLKRALPKTPPRISLPALSRAHLPESLETAPCVPRSLNFSFNISTAVNPRVVHYSFAVHHPKRRLADATWPRHKSRVSRRDPLSLYPQSRRACTKSLTLQISRLHRQYERFKSQDHSLRRASSNRRSVWRATGLRLHLTHRLHHRVLSPDRPTRIPIVLPSTLSLSRASVREHTVRARATRRGGVVARAHLAHDSTHRASTRPARDRSASASASRTRFASSIAANTIEVAIARVARRGERVARARAGTVESIIRGVVLLA